MRAFTVLAMMAVTACAVDMQAENPYKDLFGNKGVMADKDSSDTDKDDGGKTVEVDIWDTVDADLMDLMTEVQALMEIVDTQGNSLMGTQMTFTQLMNNVTGIRDTNTTNSSHLASENARDEAQDKKIHKLDEKIEKFEDKVSDLINQMTLLQLRVQNLPPLDDLNLKLATITQANADLKVLADNQSDALATINGTVNDLSGVNLTLMNHNVAFNDALVTANTAISLTDD